MKKMEISLKEKHVKGLFKVLGGNGVKEAVINLISGSKDQRNVFTSGSIVKTASVEFYLPDISMEKMRKSIVDFSQEQEENCIVEILTLEEEVNFSKKGYNTKRRGASCL